MQTLTEADFKQGARALGCDVAAIKAICKIEAPGGGFLKTGEPTILFERHVFSRLTKGRYDAAAPDISNPTPGGYGLTSAQHSRLQKAARFDRMAALKSASWGRFQIMGENFSQAGFYTLQDFVNAMYASEQAQFAAFVSFIKADPRLLKALRNHDWRVVARIFNGPAYAKNRYDIKLAQAYKDAW